MTATVSAFLLIRRRLNEILQVAWFSVLAHIFTPLPEPSAQSLNAHIQPYLQDQMYHLNSPHPSHIPLPYTLRPKSPNPTHLNFWPLLTGSPHQIPYITFTPTLGYSTSHKYLNPYPSLFLSPPTCAYIPLSIHSIPHSQTTLHTCYFTTLTPIIITYHKPTQIFVTSPMNTHKLNNITCRIHPLCL